MRTLTLDHLPKDRRCTYAHWQYTRPDADPPCHNHTFAEIFWVVGGAGVHLINGAARPLETGLLVLVRPEDRHAFSALPGRDPLRFVNFAFEPSRWTALRRRHPGLRGTLLDERDPIRREHRLDATRLERLRHLAADLADGARDALVIEAFLGGVAGLLSHSTRTRLRGDVPDWLAAACAAIQEPRHFVGGTPALARLAGRSPEHLAREIRRHLRSTPTDVVNAARLTHAAQQLATTARPIIEIAGECGFEGLGHFYKLFLARFATSPRRYRRHAVASVDVRHANWPVGQRRATPDRRA